jgi:indolepyruvate ferredoxin oxidoreductase alpha subunit
MKVLMTGNEAIARGAYEAGVHFAAAYPGTPSTEILENIAPHKEIIAEWAPNEKVAVESAVGACYAGARSITAMKHVGLNVAADPFFTIGYTGVNGGMVLVSADDPGLHSSQNEQDNRYYAKMAKVAMLEPSDSQECKDMVIKAMEISEKYDVLVMVRMTTRVCHSKSIVELGERVEVPIKPYVFKVAFAHLPVGNRYAGIRHELPQLSSGMVYIGHPVVYIIDLATS